MPIEFNDASRAYWNYAMGTEASLRIKTDADLREIFAEGIPGDLLWPGRTIDSSLPAYGSTAKSFDSGDGTYNFNAQTLSRFRKAKADAVAGIAPLHITAIGDSTSFLADYATPQNTSTWPAIMRDVLVRNLGLVRSGSGFLPVGDEHFVNNNSVTQPWEPRYFFHWGAGGSVSHMDPYGLFGTFGRNAAEIVTPTGTDLGEIVFTPGEATNEIWVYLMASGYRTKITVFDGTTVNQFEVVGYPGEAFTPTAGWTRVDTQPGYMKHSNPAGGGGLIVAKLTLPSKQTNWAAYIRSYNSSSATYFLGAEARDNTQPKAVRVSNLSDGGRSLYNMIVASNEVSGYGGLPFAFDTQKAHLAILALGLNDWQGHIPLSIFKDQLKLAVNRQRFVGATGQFLTGAGAAGDILLYITASPDFALHPPDHVNNPVYNEFLRAVYEVADELNVAVYDNSYRWKDYATSSTMFRDGIHPNRTGHADQGAALGALLAAV